MSLRILNKGILLISTINGGLKIKFETLHIYIYITYLHSRYKMSDIMITATSNERYRLKKLMKGNDGTTYPDALNEKIDDSIDAGSSIIKATYQGGNLKSIYNNGRLMDQNDRLKYIQLDSEKLEDSSDEEEFIEQIGKFGIGATKARARFSGRNGMEVTTSVDSEGNGHQIKVDMSSLLDKGKTPANCWTGD